MPQSSVRAERDPEQDILRAKRLKEVLLHWRKNVAQTLDFIEERSRTIRAREGDRLAMAKKLQDRKMRPDRAQEKTVGVEESERMVES